MGFWLADTWTSGRQLCLYSASESLSSSNTDRVPFSDIRVVRLRIERLAMVLKNPQG